MPFVISKFLPRLVSHRVLSINGTDKTTPRGRNLRTRHLCFLSCLNRESSSFTTVCLDTSTRVHHEAAHLWFVVVQTVTSLRACAFESSWKVCVGLVVRTHTQIQELRLRFRRNASVEFELCIPQPETSFRVTLRNFSPPRPGHAVRLDYVEKERGGCSMRIFRRLLARSQ